MTRAILASFACLMLVTATNPLAQAASRDSWALPTIALPERDGHPMVAVTRDERTRLRRHRDRQPVKARIARAEAALAREITYPPRGGQHNQWYQCEPCQMGLETVSDTKHRCPKCGKVYTGEPYDDVIYSRIHGANLRVAADCAWAYAITGQRRFAEKARAILIGYADRYRSYPRHDAHRNPKPSRGGAHIKEQTLSEASMMVTLIAPAADLILDSDVLSDEDRRHIRQDLILPILENLNGHRAGKGNWQTWHNAAMIWGGAVLGDPTWIERALTQKGNGFLYQMDVSVTDDGMWYENSWGYHFYTLHALVSIAEGSRRLGIDLWAHPRFKRMFTLPIRYGMPGGLLPRFGDDVNSSLTRRDALYEPAYAAYRDERLLAALPKRETWLSILYGRDTKKTAKTPSLGSEVFTTAGHAILRTEGRAGLAAAVTFGPYGGFHGHFDKLSFVFFGHGRELGVDPGRAKSQAYRLPIHTQWYKATLGHNAVLVDGRSQQPAEGALEAFAATPHAAVAVVRCDEAYEGVRYRRILAMTPEYLLVVDDLDSDNEHDYAWVYHNRGQRATCEQVTSPVDLSDAKDGLAYLQETRRDRVTLPVEVAFKDESVTTHLSLNGWGKATLLTGDGPGASVLERVPLVMLETRGRAMRFAGVLEPVRLSDAPAVKGIELASATVSASSHWLTVKREGGEDTLTVTADGVRLDRDGRPMIEAAFSPRR